MKKNYTFAASLLNVIFIMILVSEKVRGFKSNQEKINNASSNAGLVILITGVLLQPSETDDVSPRF